MIISNTCHIKSEKLPWIVLIHGFGGSKNMWKHQVDAFENDYNIMVLELPGHGDSNNGLVSYKSAGFNDVAEAIVDLIYSKGIKSADFICVSMGSLVMVSIINKFPKVVTSVIMCGAVFGMTASSMLIYKLGNVFKHFFPYMWTIRLLARILMPRKTHAISRKFLVEECKKLGRAEFMKWYSLLSHEINSLKLNVKLFKNIRSLVVMGSEDIIFLGQAIKAAGNIRNNIKLKIIKNCGHVCSLQKWREFNQIAIDFFLPQEINIKAAQ